MAKITPKVCPKSTVLPSFLCCFLFLCPVFLLVAFIPSKYRNKHMSHQKNSGFKFRIVFWRHTDMGWTNPKTKQQIHPLFSLDSVGAVGLFLSFQKQCHATAVQPASHSLAAAIHPSGKHWELQLSTKSFTYYSWKKHLPMDSICLVFKYISMSAYQCTSILDI